MMANGMSSDSSRRAAPRPGFAGFHAAGCPRLTTGETAAAYDRFPIKIGAARAHHAELAGEERRNDDRR